MNNITDVNKGVDALLGLNGVGKDTSILSSLFSINFNSEEISTENGLKNNFIDKEFVFEDDDIKIIDYISNIIPDFESKKNSLTDLSEIGNKVKLDANLGETEKNKILNLIKLGLTSLKEIKLEIPDNKKFKKLLAVKSFKKPNDVNEIIKPLNNKKNITNLNNFKSTNNINININQDKVNNQVDEKIVNDLTEQQVNKNQKKPINFQDTSFVKKIKKNNHPNKIYDLAKVSTIQQDQFNIKSNNNIVANQLNSQLIESSQKSKVNENKNNQNLGFQQSNQLNNTTNNYSHNGNTSFSNNGYNSVLENFLDNLDLTQKGWTSKLVSRIENSLVDGGGEIEFNLKPKNLGKLKVSVTLKEGVGSVKIVTENSFVTTALNQNESYLQKLFNDQGINLEFSAKNENQNFGSKNEFNQNSNNKKENQELTTEKQIDELDESSNKNNSSRHIINVIA